MRFGPGRAGAGPGSGPVKAGPGGPEVVVADEAGGELEEVAVDGVDAAGELLLGGDEALRVAARERLDERNEERAEVLRQRVHVLPEEHVHPCARGTGGSAAAGATGRGGRRIARGDSGVVTVGKFACAGVQEEKQGQRLERTFDHDIERLHEVHQSHFLR